MPKYTKFGPACPAAWRDLVRAWEISVTAPQVITMRCMQTALRDRNADDLALMSSEKVHAFSEAWLAMMTESWLYWARLAGAMARSGPRALHHTPPPNLLGRGLTPVHRTVMANHKRLTRPRRGR